MNAKLVDFKELNLKHATSITNKMFDNSFLKEDYLKTSMQEQLYMHLEVVNKLDEMREKEVKELKEYIATKTARIMVIEDTIKRLSESSLNLGSIRDSLNSDNIEEGIK